MNILFTTSNSILSRMIRRATRGDCSHCALGVGGVVIHMNLLGLQIELRDSFLQHSTIVHEVPVECERSRLWQHIAKCYKSRYDFGGLLYLGLRAIFPKLPPGNLWQSTGLILCTEFITVYLDGSEDHTITPYQLYLRLANKGA